MKRHVIHFLGADVELPIYLRYPALHTSFRCHSLLVSNIIWLSRHIHYGTQSQY